jgi:hypothetical protein
VAGEVELGAPALGRVVVGAGGLDRGTDPVRERLGARPEHGAELRHNGLERTLGKPAPYPRRAEHARPVGVDLGATGHGTALHPLVRAVEVEAVYYGALEMTGRDGVTPVVRLDGLLHLQAWAEALGTGSTLTPNGRTFRASN